MKSKDKIVASKNVSWIWLENFGAEDNKKLIEQELGKENNGNVGKYLFFSDNQRALISIAKRVMKEYNLYNAKVSSHKNKKSGGGFGYVLCIYDVAENQSGGKLKYKLKEYSDFKKVHYRYWKFDKDTFEGKYSTEFLKTRNEIK